MNPQVGSVLVDMCIYGMVVRDTEVEGLARKRTRLMSNLHEVLKRVKMSCTHDHEHIPLVQVRAKKCQVYPQAFCRTIVDCIAAKKKLREIGMVALPLLDIDDLEHDMKNGAAAVLDLHDCATMQAFDDQSSEALDPILARKARTEEMEHFRSMQVYEKVPISESI